MTTKKAIEERARQQARMLFKKLLESIRSGRFRDEGQEGYEPMELTKVNKKFQ
ncbi:MAG: hypothetical protein QXV17_06975 [Candidatus Micrarchaeaceae archaeon]